MWDKNSSTKGFHKGLVSGPRANQRGWEAPAWDGLMGLAGDSLVEVGNGELLG